MIDRSALDMTGDANQARDKELKPCQNCHAEYNDPGRRLGPTCIVFTRDYAQVVCLNCWTHSLGGKTQDEAISNHNDGKVRISIRDTRIAAGLSVEQACEATGIKRTTWRDYEAYRHRPSRENTKKIAALLGVEARLL